MIASSFSRTRQGALLALLLAVALPGLAAAAETCPPAPEKPAPAMLQAAMRDARDHGFLWRITKGGHTSFLYGTIHVSKLDWMFPGPKVKQALNAADTVALEIDVLDEETRTRMAKGMASLRSFALPDPLAKHMREQAAALCVPYDAIASYPPELQVSTLSIVSARWDGLDAAFAVDAILAGLAHGAKKNVVSLETPELQLKLLQMPDERETIALVQDDLDELATGRSRKMLRHIAKVWADSDYDDMAHFDAWCECLDTESERNMLKRLNDERNPSMADRIDALHASGKQVFAAVGSMHMFGPKGLPALMEQRGYGVERVDLKALDEPR